MMADLRSLYQEIILDHNKNPRNYRKLDDADRIVEGYNPLCGDHYTIFVKLEEQTIKEITFQGSGCAISKASTSVMSSVLRGKKIEEAEEWFEKFHKMVMGGSIASEDFDDMGRLAAFSGVSEFPTRVKCATLPWHTVRGALKSNVKTVSTE